MSKKQVYVTLCRFLGGGTVEAGSPIELTPAQAAHPLYRNRVRLRDAIEPKLTPSLAEKKEKQAISLAEKKEKQATSLAKNGGEQPSEDSPPVGDGIPKPWNKG